MSEKQCHPEPIRQDNVMQKASEFRISQSLFFFLIEFNKAAFG